VGNELKVGEVMTPNPPYVHKGELATKVRAIFRRSKFKGLPVVDEKSRVLGLITVKDLLKVTSTRSNLTADGIMGRVMVFLTPDEDVTVGVKKMLQAKVDRAVVVDSASSMRLLGVLSMHDVIKALQRANPIKETLVEDFMTREVVTCSPAEPVTKVWRKMEEGDISGLPVVKKKVVGMITRNDILAAGYARIRKENEKSFSKRATPVEKVMRSPAITISPRATLGEAMKIMVSKNIGRLPVVEKGRLLGIIDREDVLRQSLEGFNA
jgi:CBS domain-containing protein